MPVGGRVAGKVGIYSSHYNGNVDPWVHYIAIGIFPYGHVDTKAIFDVEDRTHQENASCNHSLEYEKYRESFLYRINFRYVDA